MALGPSLILLAVGASLLGALTRSAIPPAAWLALTALLHASRSMPGWSGLLSLFCAVYVALAVAERDIYPMPGAAYFGAVAFMAASITLPFVLDRVVGSRFGSVGSTLVFPLAWVAVEFLRSRVAPPATWGSIAYTQYGFLPLMQLTAFVGLWGITFVIAWFASTFELASSRGFDLGAVRAPVLVYAAVVGAIVAGGCVRLALAPSDRPSIRAATLNRPADLFVPGEMTHITEGSVSASDRPRVAVKLSRLHDWFLDGSRREARAGARLIVWPEQNLLVFADDEAAFLERAKRLATDEHVYLAMGMGTIHLGARLPFENKVVVIDPAGHILVSYRKSHPVAGWEDSIMIRGDGKVPIAPTPQGRIATAICFDADFPEFVRQAAQGSADILVLAVNDWKAVKDLHFQMHAFRAVETGIPVVRAAASGLSSAFDPWGRVLGIADSFADGDRTLTVQVPVGGVRTVYARTGDLFAWLCVAALVTAVGLARVAPVSRPVPRVAAAVAQR
jgi:apolipoprotein N-acyltransferase